MVNFAKARQNRAFSLPRAGLAFLLESCFRAIETLALLGVLPKIHNDGVQTRLTRCAGRRNLTGRGKSFPDFSDRSVSTPGRRQAGQMRPTVSPFHQPVGFDHLKADEPRPDTRINIEARLYARHLAQSQVRRETESRDF